MSSKCFVPALAAAGLVTFAAMGYSQAAEGQEARPRSNTPKGRPMGPRSPRRSP